MLNLLCLSIAMEENGIGDINLLLMHKAITQYFLYDFIDEDLHTALALQLSQLDIEEEVEDIIKMLLDYDIFYDDDYETV